MPRYRDRDGAEGGAANAAPVPQDRHARAEGIAQVIDDLATFETDSMSWLRRTAPIARRLNEESHMDASFGETQ